MGAHGKIMILSFTEDEGNIYKRILEVINNCESFEWCNVSQNIEVIHAGALEIDLMERCVSVDSVEVKLTNTEFEILYLLVNNPGRVFSKEQIYDIIWQEPYSGDYNIVMSHIHNIREKIEGNSKNPIYIQTVWGIGYRFNKNLRKATKSN